MAEKPDDRPKKRKHNHAKEDPIIYFIASGKKFLRPGLDSYFAEAPAAGDANNESLVQHEGCLCQPVVIGSYCSCNKVSSCKCVPVCTCESVCSCVGHTICRCVGHTSCGCVGHTSCGCVGDSSYGGYQVTGCRCAPVH